MPKVWLEIEDTVAEPPVQGPPAAIVGDAEEPAGGNLEFEPATIHVKSEPKRHYGAKTIGILSGKGGVGKTTLAANLGIALVRTLRKRVLLVDGNITTANLSVLLNVLETTTSLNDVLEDRVPIEQAIYRILIDGPHSHHQDLHLHLLPSSLSAKKIPDATKLSHKLARISRFYDFVIIDGAAGLGREALATLAASSELLVVATPDIASIASALKVIEVARDMKVPVAGVALNRVRGKNYEMTRREVESICETQVVSRIPEDNCVLEGGANHTPFIVDYPNSPSAIEVKRLAALLANERYVHTPGWKRLLHKVSGIFRLAVS